MYEPYVNAPFWFLSDPLSSMTHFLGLALALIGTFFLIKKGRGNNARLTALSIYCFGMIFMFSMSAVFHLIDAKYTARLVMQRLDHAGIWAMIAGSFTPIHWILLRGLWRWFFLMVIWTLSIVGIVLKTVFFYEIPEWMGLTFYLCLGWLGVLSYLKIKSLYGRENTRFLFWGGLCYTVGAVCESMRFPVLIEGILGPHEIFHVLVVAGALYHWLFIYHWSNYPVSNHLKVLIRERPNSLYIAEGIGEKLSLHAKSLDQLKQLIQEWVQNKYHHKQPAHSVQLQYQKEEYLK